MGATSTRPLRGRASRAWPRRLAIQLACLIALGCDEHDEASFSLSLDTIVTISFRNLPAPTLGSPIAVTTDRDRIAVALRDGGEIMLFDGEGGFVQQIGRRGEGPGEFREISLISFHPGSDSLWVFDEGNARISIFAPNTTMPSRDIRLDGRFVGAAWASDTILVVQGLFTDGGAEYALGRAVHPGGVSLALPERVVGLRFPDFIRPLTASAAGGLWVGDFRRTNLRRLDETLTVSNEFEYDAPIAWEPPTNAGLWVDYIDTKPAVLDLTEDADGHLWVLFGVPVDPLPNVADPGRALAEGQIEVADLARNVLARYDPGTITIGPSAVFDVGQFRGGLLPGGLAYFYETDAVGEPVLTIGRLGIGRSVPGSDSHAEGG